MRAISTAQQGVLTAGNQAEFVRVSIKDGGGTFRDLTSYPGFNSVRNVTWGETIDNPHQTFTVDLIREMYGFSLSPFVAGSPVNTGFVPGGTFSPLIALNREVKIEVAIVPMGMQPSSGDWFEVLRGRIDTLDAGSTTNVNIAGRGLSGRLAQAYIKQDLVYSFAADGGTSVALLIWSPNMTVVAGDYVLPASRGGGATPDPGAPGGVPMFLKCATGGTTGTTEPVWTTGAGQTDGTAAWNYIGSTTTAGNPVEQVMQNLIDRNKGAGDPAVTIYVPSSPLWGISQFDQSRTFVLDAVRTLAQQIGWDLRYKWRGGTAQFEFTLYQPTRSSPSVDYTFAPSEFYAPTTIAVDISVIRNFWEITYSDAADLWPDLTPKRKQITVSDSTSIAKYGELYAEIQEDSASQIDTAAEATTLVNSALSDCKEPNAVMGIALVRGFPWVELNDYYKFTAGGVVPHFDSDQSLAVTQYSHTIQGGDKAQLKTTISVRGLPTIGTGAWLGNIVHPKIPPRFNTSTAHKKKSFSGVNTAKQSLKSSVGGVQGFVGQTFDKNHQAQDYEVHIYPVSGTALSSSTLYALTRSLSGNYSAGLTPGKLYYMKTVPRTHDGRRMDRGEASGEQSFIAGQALAGHLSAEPDLTRLPLNGGFETNFNAAEPPDHWAEPTGTWGTDVTLVASSGGVTGGNYISFANTATAKELDSDLFPVEAAALYSLSAWVNENHIGGNGQIELKWYDSSRAAISGSEIDLGPPGGFVLGGHWIHRKGAVLSPSTARFAKVRIFQVNSGAADGFLVDKIEVKRLNYCGALVAYAATLPNTNGTVYLAPAAVNTLANQLITQLAGEMVLFGLVVTSRTGGGTINYTVTVNSTLFGTTAATPITLTLTGGALTGQDTTNTFANATQNGTAQMLGVSFQLDCAVTSGTPAPNVDVMISLGIWQ